MQKRRGEGWEMEGERGGGLKGVRQEDQRNMTFVLQDKGQKRDKEHFKKCLLGGRNPLQTDLLLLGFNTNNLGGQLRRPESETLRVRVIIAF